MDAPVADAGAFTREAGYVALSRGRAANHLYVPDDHDDLGDGPSSLVEDGRHLDRLAARLTVQRTQTLATRQLPREMTNRWRPSVSQDPPNCRAEGRSI